MKIRTGFVSNSSSSSFVGWGVSINTDDLIKAYCELHEKCEDDYDCDYEMLWNLAEENGFRFVLIDYNDCGFFGMEYTSMRDDETKGEFKKRVESKIDKLFGKNYADKCGSIEKVWRDG